MGQQFRTRTRSTISLASTASPKSTSFSMQNCLASPSFPSSISCWCCVSFMAMAISIRWGSVVCLELRLARDRDGGLLADLRRVDFDPVAGLDRRDRVLVQAVDGGDSTGDGSTDVDVVDFLADDGCWAMMGLRALVVQADGTGGGAHHSRIDHDLVDHALALDVGPGHQDDSILVAHVVESPPHPLAI